MIIQNDKICATIDLHGAELTSLKKQGSEEELIWTADKYYWGRHAPMLFPIVGKVWNSEYRVGDKIYHHEKGWGPYDFNLYKLSDEEKAKLTGLPASLDEAIAELEKDHDYLTAGGVFPERLINQIIARNKTAASAVSKLPHPMEFAMYYDL